MRFRSAVPALPVGDTATAAEFYERTLGLRTVHREAAVAILVRDEVELHLWAAADRTWQARTLPPGATPIESGAESFLAGTGSCRIAVEDIAALYAACEAAQIVHPNGALADKPWGATEFAILDPDGNCVTFTESSRPAG